VKPEPLYVSIPQAGRRAFDVGTTASYRAAHNGHLPVVKINGRMMVPVAELLKLAGVDTPASR